MRVASCNFRTNNCKFPTAELVSKESREILLWTVILHLCKKIIWNFLIQYQMLRFIREFRISTLSLNFLQHREVSIFFIFGRNFSYKLKFGKGATVAPFSLSERHGTAADCWGYTYSSDLSDRGRWTVQTSLTVAEWWSIGIDCSSSTGSRCLNSVDTGA